MRSYALASILVAAIASTAVADPDPFVAGNTAAAAGDHVAAAAAFERTIATQGWSPGTLFDLGNAYASSGHRGRAILAYERAHLLAPRDHAITANLAHELAAAGVSVPPPSRITATLAMLTSDEWTWIAIAAAILACTGVVGFAWSIKRPFARTLALAGTAVAMIAFAVATHVAPSPDEAIVVTHDTARIAPFASAEAAFMAPEGEPVHIAQQRGDFVYVRDGDRSGWLPASAVERIVRSDRSGAGA